MVDMRLSWGEPVFVHGVEALWVEPDVDALTDSGGGEDTGAPGKVDTARPSESFIRRRSRNEVLWRDIQWIEPTFEPVAAPAPKPRAEPEPEPEPEPRAAPERRAQPGADSAEPVAAPDVAAAPVATAPTAASALAHPLPRREPEPPPRREPEPLPRREPDRPPDHASATRRPVLHTPPGRFWSDAGHLSEPEAVLATAPRQAQSRAESRAAPRSPAPSAFGTTETSTGAAGRIEPLLARDRKHVRGLRAEQAAAPRPTGEPGRSEGLRLATGTRNWRLPRVRIVTSPKRPARSPLLPRAAALAAEIGRSVPPQWVQVAGSAALVLALAGAGYFGSGELLAKLAPASPGTRGLARAPAEQGGAAAPAGNAASEAPRRTMDTLARAKAGDPGAQYTLAVAYARGDGMAQDYAGAARWFREAAVNGSVAAQFNLGVLYERGLGVAQNMSEALVWYRSAAERNYPPAEYNLAIAHAEGRGTPTDLVAAARWYHSAAVQGLVPAMINFAILYEKGDGVGRSLLDAYAWYRAAAKRGDAAGEKRAGELYQHFSEGERGRAAALAAQVEGSIKAYAETASAAGKDGEATATATASKPASGSAPDRS